jgi:arginyl-tRNA--protein-N-Asp/Glu arginylyltransferase
MSEAAGRAAARARLTRLLGGLRLMPSPPAPCPYLPGRASRLVALRPNRLSPQLYGLFLDLNFRRLQDLVYRPQCDGCRECRELRIDAARFRPNRSQRRCLKRNADLAVDIGRPAPSQEKHSIYRRYLEARHDGSMSGSWSEYLEFLHAVPPFTEEAVFRVGTRVVGVSIYDATPEALSAVYFYFDPELAGRSPGTFNVLWLIEEARRRSLPWLYLGYYVPGSRQMSYKAGFHPHQLLENDGRWREVGPRSGGRMAP